MPRIPKKWQAETFSICAAARVAGVDPSTLHVARRAGKLPVRRDGWLWVVDRRDLLRWLVEVYKPQHRIAQKRPRAAAAIAQAARVLAALERIDLRQN